MGRFDMCVHLGISIMHVEGQVMYFSERHVLRGRLVGQKFLAEAVVGLFLRCYGPG